MRTIWNYLIFMITLAGFPILLWAASHLISKSYIFWKEGKEKPALVLEHVSTSAGYRKVTSFKYRIQIDGTERMSTFYIRLPVGSYVNVLTHPSHPDELIPAREKDSWFHIYSLLFGSKVMGVLTLGTFIFMAIFGPFALKELLKNRNKILKKMNG